MFTFFLILENINTKNRLKLTINVIIIESKKKKRQFDKDLDKLMQNTISNLSKQILLWMFLHFRVFSLYSKEKKRKNKIKLL